MIETVTKRFLKLIIAFAMIITSFTAPTRTVRAEDEVPGSKIQLNGDEELTPADKDLKKVKSWKFKAKTESGVFVYVNDPNGYLPKKAKMVVEDVDPVAVKNLVKKNIKGYIYDITAVDISFWYKGEEVEPTGPVSVSIWKPGTDKNSTKTLFHIDDSKKVHVIDEVETVEEDELTASTFEADGFSIYAIVSSGEDARLKVVFKNGDTEIDSMYVKEKDDMEVVLYDPGVGTLEAGVYFRGWTTDPNYTPKTEAKTVADIRTEVAGLLPPAADGTERVYYAMLFKEYRITYLDENDISLGQEQVPFRADSTTAEQDYTVNMAYTVQDDTHNFEGWNVNEGGTYIAGHTEGKVYQNKDEITIT
ncbi:MAG: hypothetical protein IIY75_07350, partial [Erysipelotrichales bacterium]|nr:hypothetical protein [Erysipelotrichales bacterium]